MRKPAIANAKPARKSNLAEVPDEDLLVSKRAGQMQVLTSSSLPKLPAKRSYTLGSPFSRALESAGADKAERWHTYSDPQSLPYRFGVRGSAHRSAGDNRARAESSRGLWTPRERQPNDELRFSCSEF